MEKDCSPYAFTGRFTMFRGRIVSDIILCSPDEGNPNAIRIRALWDTGCSKTIISKRAADFLDLPGAGSIVYKSPFGGANPCELRQAKVCIVLGAARLPLDVGVNDKPNSDLDCDITLGLDFITQGDFALTHDDQQLILSFCYPPLDAPIFYDKWSKKFRPESEVESIVINEKRAVESRRRQLIMLDYYKEAHEDKHRRKNEENEEDNRKIDFFPLNICPCENLVVVLQCQLKRS